MADIAEQFGQWDLKAVKELMDKMASTGLTALNIKDGEFTLTLEAKKELVISQAPPALTAVPVQAAGSAPAAASVQSAPAVAEGNVVKSPIVGTFYASAAPDKPPFVQVGSKVKKGDVLFVIESMKLMNEIQSDFTGEVTEILVENAQAVEYNQPVLVIE